MDASLLYRHGETRRRGLHVDTACAVQGLKYCLQYSLVTDPVLNNSLVVLRIENADKLVIAIDTCFSDNRVKLVYSTQKE